MLVRILILKIFLYYVYDLGIYVILFCNVAFFFIFCTTRDEEKYKDKEVKADIFPIQKTPLLYQLDVLDSRFVTTLCYQTVPVVFQAKTIW